MKRPSFKVETIDAETAARYLEQNRKNRPASAKTSNAYASAIRRGEWLMNAEAIKFDWDGNLVDGQHRLRAVVVAGRPADFLVARDLDPAVFATLDQGKLRSVGDVLAMRGIRYHFPIGAAYRALWRFIVGDRTKRRLTNSELLQMVDAHPDLVQRGYEAMTKPLDASAITASARVFFFYLAHSIDADKARDYLAGLARPNAKQINAAKLRKRIAETEIEVIPPSPRVRWAWLVLGWNATLHGRVIDRYPRAFDKLPEFEPRPRIRMSTTPKRAK